jgi:dihydrodipicolinate synthase/N-acetylneuraminate lyase
MKTVFTRRDCLTWFGSAAALSTIPRPERLAAAAAAAAASGKTMRGPFMILATPYTASGAVDWSDLANEAAWVESAGCAGMVWPQGSSGVANLTRDERMKGMEVLVQANKGRKAVLGLGVQGKDTAEMLEYATRAEALGPDAMICMPPKAGTSQNDYYEYFKALAGVTKRPVILQTSGGNSKLAPSTDLIVQLAKEFANFGYVKEESEPVVERMKSLVKQRPPMRSVFGAEFGNGWLYEMRLGLDGVITGNVPYADVMARIWSLHLTGKADDLRDAYGRFLLMRNITTRIAGTDAYLLHKRGIFKTMTTRVAAEAGKPGPNVKTIVLSADEMAEIDYRFDGLKPYLAIKQTS